MAKRLSNTSPKFDEERAHLTIVCSSQRNTPIRVNVTGANAVYSVILHKSKSQNARNDLEERRCSLSTSWCVLDEKQRMSSLRYPVFYMAKLWVQFVSWFTAIGERVANRPEWLQRLILMLRHYWQTQNMWGRPVDYSLNWSSTPSKVSQRRSGAWNRSNYCAACIVRLAWGRIATV